MAQGFHLVVLLCSVSSLKWYELEAWVCGRKDYDPDVLLANCTYEGLAPDDERVLYLRQALNSFTRHQRALFMRFVSGRERMPAAIHLRIISDNSAPLVGGPPAAARPSTSPVRGDHGGGAAAEPRPVTANAIDNNRLPHASTCFYQLVLPRYSSADALREKLLLAIEYCLDIDADFHVRDSVAHPLHGEQETDIHVEEVNDEAYEDYTHLQ
ncbi:hypothetical protein STCU_12329 [Strigomonas culicis]|uniref:HECT domain-containing protein n=1 Tax=Strigomonas culicis TaxID=28005 RepID=S9TAY3_9TRYP|nr:hypothetical protein STCU_12329 [Strigomonas culicis]|eukprot:EPY15132.1 hypothetical protein STCU_12329 [Strigomonas culicis]